MGLGSPLHHQDCVSEPQLQAHHSESRLVQIPPGPPQLTIVTQMIAEQHEHELIWWGGRQALITQRANAEQLKAYDKKVHRAQSEMFNAMSGQLKSLGVPFFGVKPELIANQEEAGAGANSDAGSRAKITPDELLKLQKKMIEYLEDMYKD